MFRIYEVAKQHRLTLGAALIAALVLILIGHAPVIPVIAGSVLAVGFLVWRRKS